VERLVGFNIGPSSSHLRRGGVRGTMMGDVPDR